MPQLKSGGAFAAFGLAFAAGFALPAGALAQAPFDGDLLAGMKARLVGPAAMSGRIASIEAVASDPNTIVVGAATGGVWISRNGGLTWDPVFDKEAVASIGAVAIDPNNPKVIWVGTGEGNTRNSTSIGAGVFKSVDGGKTWKQLGLERTERINRIVLHPTNPDIAYVAALGPLWSEGADRGLYKTEDGGKTWRKVLFVDAKTGATDVQMAPGDPNTLVAAMWEFRRWPYFFKSGGPGSSLHISKDGGETWKKLTEEDGLPKGELGRAQFAFAPSNANRIYALIEAEKSALVRSDDGGESWATVNSDSDINDRPFYYNDIRVDPKDENRVYRVGSQVKLSIDGGKTFENIAAISCCAPGGTIHIDNHAWWINPNDPRHIIDGNDGGVAISHDRGETWRYIENLPLAQFYHVAVDNAEPYNIYGGLQDNGSWRGPSEVFENGGIRNFHWREVAFGDGFDTQPDPEDPSRGYAMSQGGNLYAWSLANGELRLIKPDRAPDEKELRFNWNSGFAQDPFDPATIYYGSQYVHRSRDRGRTWEILSGDLTSNDPKLQTFTESGGLTPDVTAAETHTTIVAIAPSPREQGVIWVGSDDGRVHVTRDGGQSWQSVERGLRGGPVGGWVPFIEPSPFENGAAFVVVDDHRRGDMRPHVYRVSDYGARWSRLKLDGVTGYALSIRQDPIDPSLLFLGTEFGLWVSLDGGGSWTKWTAGVPTASVMDMAIQPRETDLVVATHGRAVFVIDDYSGLRGLDADDFRTRFKLLGATPGVAYTPQQVASSRFSGSTEFIAENEPRGVLVSFLASGNDLPHPDEEQERARKIAERAKAPAKAEGSEEKKDEKKDPKVTVTVADASGAVIRTFFAKPHQGLNRIVWDMTADGLLAPPPAKPPEDGGLPSGIEVPPGTYTLTLAFDGQKQSVTAEVRPDPRVAFDATARAANHAARQEIQAMQKAAFAAIERLLGAKRDLETALTLIKDAEKAQAPLTDGAESPYKALREEADALKKKLEEAEKSFRDPPDAKGIPYSDEKTLPRIGTAAFYVASSYAAPSEAAKKEMALARKTLERTLGEANALIAGDVARFRARVQQAGFGLLAQQPVAAP